MPPEYFAGCVTEKQLKSRMRELAKQHHPDKGGSTEVMAEINNQFQKRLKGHFSESVSASGFSTEGAAFDQMFKEYFAEQVEKYEERIREEATRRKQPAREHRVNMQDTIVMRDSLGNEGKF